MSVFVPRFNGLIGKHTFQYSGAIEWNTLPFSVQSLEQRSHFKKKVKSFLSNQVVQQEANQFIY